MIVASGRDRDAPRCTSPCQQFSLAVSSHAFQRGLSGILAAGFADQFDRKRLLLFFITGFVLGTCSAH